MNENILVVDDEQNILDLCKDLLENELKLKVDLVTENALKEQLKESILKSVKYF